MDELGAPPSPRRRYYFLAAVLVALAALALAARPAYRMFKHWRALQLIEASAQALRSGELDEAFRQANLALLQSPDDPRVVRQVAVVYTELDPVQALPWWRQTLALSRDPADRRDFILCALAARDLPLAAAQLLELQKTSPDDPQTWLTEARLHLAVSQWPEALAALKRVLDTGQASEEAHLLYAQAAQLSRDPAVQAAGLAHLRLLSGRSDALGLAALRTLAGGVPGQNPYQLEDVARQLAAHPQATLDDKLRVLSLRARLPGANDAALVLEARALFAPGDDAGLAAIGRWLNGRRKYEEVLSLIDSASARARRDLLLVRLDAMAQLGQWPAILDALGQPHLPLPEELRLLFEARALTELGRQQRATLAWDRLRLQVADEPQKLFNVGLYAAQLGLADVARPNFEKLLQNAEFRRRAYEQLIRLERAQRRTARLHEIFTDMARHYPGDPVIQNDTLYTGFLLGRAGPEQLAAANTLVRQFPYMAAYRYTLALGCLVANQPQSALAAFEGWHFSDMTTVEPSWRAILAATLRANGLDAGPSGAKELEKLIPRQALLPEERDLLDRPPPPAGN